ncbi:MAG: Ig-like domain-containing protein, partial [Spirochaetes bacterium]|nr:Ig-like domain-containing protein [Spirochaetota bacterium]
NQELRDLGIFLYTNMVQAIEQYWFDIDNEVFPQGFDYPGVGIVWGSGGAHATWFGNTPEFIYGINMLPFTGGSLYLGHHPEYVQNLYNSIVSENGGVENDWVDIIWQYQAFVDPQAALTKFGNGNYTVFDGESKAHTYHWLHNFNALGNVDKTITADIPTYAVFNKNGKRTYVAYNPDSTLRLVRFSDGKALNVHPRSLASGEGFESDYYQLTIKPDNLTTGSGTYQVGSTVNISYVGNGFVKWAGDTQYLADIYSSSTTLTMPGSNITITAETEEKNIPGRIESEDYIQYYDTSAGNTGGVYRFDDVDIEECIEGGYNVGWIESGEWLEYSVYIEESGKYDLDIRVASINDSGKLIVYINENDITGQVNINLTGDWQNWTTQTITDVELTAGSHTLKLLFVEGSFNINYIDFQSSVINQPPQITITHPTDHSTYTSGDNLTIHADASDSDGYISQVEFFSNNISLGIDATSPYSISWNNLEAGTYTITAVATDNENLTATSSEINITVENQPSGFEYSGVLPNGLIDGQQVSYTTTASFDGTNVTITFESTTSLNMVYLYIPGFNDIQLEGTQWKSSLPGFSDGDTLTWYFTAIGSNGQADNSSARHTWTVKKSAFPGNNQVPIVNITSPLIGEQFDFGETITITTQACDEDGTITKVDFYNNDTLVGSDSTTPYTFQWDNVNPGNYHIFVKTYDNQGAQDMDFTNIVIQ